MGHHEDPIDYILAQVRENLKYLQNKGRVSESAARQINDLLDKPANPAAPVAAGERRAFSPSSAPPVRSAPPPQQQQQQPQTQYVRALYDYNAPGDLNFRAGDVIELAPTPNDNDDWWTGRLNGREGLFPSNHVERIPSPPQQHPATPHRLPPPPSLSEPSGAWNEKPPIPTYNSSAPPFTGYPGQGSVGGQPAPTTVIVHADANPDGGDPAKKKNKFGKLGSTMGNAAAGGVGFGAGAAIGGGIINAIF